MKDKASHKKEKSKLSQMELDHTEVEEKKMNKSFRQKKRDGEKKVKVGTAESEPNNSKFDDEVNEDNHKAKLSRKRKTNKVIASKSGVEKADNLTDEVEGDLSGQNVSQNAKCKMRKKRRKDEKGKKSGEEKADEIHREVEDIIEEENAKQKDAHKEKKKNRTLPKKDKIVLEKKVETEQNDVYEMSSGDEDCSRGMKKWITEYHQSRPGLKVLQDQIDDFITAHEAQEEEARREREAQAAEGGWTVVTHHKGRKKTTEAETGTVVGSVAPATAMENMTKKKNNQVGINFYRFQKREAQMNELMQLQSKFEQDKKRIQQMRAARKFRPY